MQNLCYSTKRSRKARRTTQKRREEKPQYNKTPGTCSVADDAKSHTRWRDFEEDTYEIYDSYKSAAQQARRRRLAHDTEFLFKELKVNRPVTPELSRLHKYIWNKHCPVNSTGVTAVINELLCIVLHVENVLGQSVEKIGYLRAAESYRNACVSKIKTHLASECNAARYSFSDVVREGHSLVRGKNGKLEKFYSSKRLPPASRGGSGD